MSTRTLARRSPRANTQNAKPLRLTKTMRAMVPHASQAAELLRALANEQRLLILCNLAAGELSVGELNERLPLSQSALSQHLAVLRETGIVATRRESQTIYYMLNDGPAARVVETLYNIYCN
jgi:DNA-binding transcriptional ArsR family regulator